MVVEDYKTAGQGESNGKAIAKQKAALLCRLCKQPLQQLPHDKNELSNVLLIAEVW
jgi:hypothetical protein